jgi:CheY-like chemotaxis protein
LNLRDLAIPKSPDVAGRGNAIAERFEKVEAASMEMPFPILLLEDDENDVFIFKRSLEKAGIPNPIHLAKDGQEGISYMAGEGQYSDRQQFPLPKVIICDLKMPRKTGLEFLAWLKDHPELTVIPTIVLTSSAQDIDVVRAYQLGANTYFLKPGTYEEMQVLVKKIREYWTAAIRPKWVQ